MTPRPQSHSPEATDCTQQETKNSHDSKSRWVGYAAAGAAALAAGDADAANIVNMGNLDLSGGPFTLSLDGTLALDLNDDGSTDITIRNYASYSFGGSSYAGRAFASGSAFGAVGHFFGTAGPYNYANRLSRVSSIGPNAPLSLVSPRPGTAGYYDNIFANAQTWYFRDGTVGYPLSGWGSAYNSYNVSTEANNTPGFLGVQFDIGGNTHYGFVELDIDVSVLNGNGFAANVARIFSYGYEDVPDSHISGPGNADFDRDGDVDVADMLQFQRGVGLPTPLQPDGDANRDGTVDGDDLAILESQFGDGSQPIANLGAVPEPNTLGLIAVGAVGLSAVRRIRRNKQQDSSSGEN